MIPKSPRNINNPNYLHPKPDEVKTPQSSIKKVTLTKFTRQNQPKQTNKKSLKTSNVSIPNLNLNIFNLDHKNHQKHLTRVQSNETKIPLTTYRNSDQQINIVQSQLNIPTSTQIRNQNSPMDKLIKSKKSKQDSDSLISSTDKEELLLLEIKQLKRQNTFLKKKIRDLKKQINGGFLPEEYQSNKFQQKNEETKRMKKKGAAKLKSESLHLTVNLFFEEIRNVLNSVTQLFRIDLSQQEVNKFQLIHGEDEIEELNDDICPLRKHEILKKYYLNRKLERLALQQDDKRYETLLGIFTEYYSFKEQSEKKVVEMIDKMIMYMNDLNGWLIEKAYAKRMKSEVISEINTQRDQVSIFFPKFQNLKVPPSSIANYVSKKRGLTLSPMPKAKEIE